jgi:hypothetical protein
MSEIKLSELAKYLDSWKSQLKELTGRVAALEGKPKPKKKKKPVVEVNE